MTDVYIVEDSIGVGLVEDVVEAEVVEDTITVIIDNVLPGMVGAKGDKAVNWKGNYSAETSYIIDDAVYYLGSSYVCIKDSLDNLPSDTEFFELMAAKGADGAVVATTTVADATYDVAVTDGIVLLSYTATGAVTVTLATVNLTDGRIVYIKDIGGDAVTNNITIDTEGTETIDGEDTFVINNNYNAVTLASDGVNWSIV